MIQRFRPSVLPATGVHPALLCDRRSRMPCGCQVVVGIRLDNHEAATAAIPCPIPEHSPLMADFQARFVASLQAPASLEAVEVADLILEQVFRDAGEPTGESQG